VQVKQVHEFVNHNVPHVKKLQVDQI